MPETARFELPHSLDTYERLGDWALQLAGRAASIESMATLHESLSDTGLELALRIVRGYGEGRQNLDRSLESFTIAEYDHRDREQFSAQVETDTENIAAEDSPNKLFTIRQTTGSRRRRKVESFTIPISGSEGVPLLEELRITRTKRGKTNTLTRPSDGARVVASLFQALSAQAKKRDQANAA